jgi:hypothetical protein
MKPVFLLLCASLFCITSYSQVKKDDCSFLKQTVLQYEGTDDSTSYVMINGNKHIEYSNNNQNIIKSDIEWITPCEWKMTMTEIRYPDFPFKPGDTMHVKINRIENGIIYYTSTVKGTSWEGRFKIMERKGG